MPRRTWKNLSVAFILSLALPILITTIGRTQELCTDREKIREHLEASISDSSHFKVLLKCGSDVVPYLIEVLENEEPNTNLVWSARTLLGRMGSAAVPDLVKLLDNKEPKVRQNAAEALGMIGSDAKDAALPLARLLEKKNEDLAVRQSAVQALVRMKAEAKAAVSILVQLLKDKDNEKPEVLRSIIDALGNIGSEAKDAVLPLIDALEDDDSDDSEIRRRAAIAIGRIGFEAKAAVTSLSKLVEDKNQPEGVRYQATLALSRIAEAHVDKISQSRSHKGKLLDLKSKILYFKQLNEAIDTVSTIEKSLENSGFDDEQRAASRSLSSLKSEKNSWLMSEAIQWFSNIRNVWVIHGIFWLALVFAYPKSPQIQAIFFWNPWLRRITGLGYVGLALTWVPFLRARLFSPFKESLLSDAHLDDFNPKAYFADSDVKFQGKIDAQPIREAIPEIRGQIVLEGESGLGKSMFLRHLVKQSQQITVYLPAIKCHQGVMEAIQAKLHGCVQEDPNFLKNLIYSGAIYIAIDGLNEVTPDTRAKITNFVESYFKCNIIMTTQPLEWNPPSTAKTYILQPLRGEQIEHFLLSRRAILTEEAQLKGSEYEQACKSYIATILNQQQSTEEQIAIRGMLSNPMDLTTVALMLSRGETPDLLNLEKQQYEIMKEDYEYHSPSKNFPLKAFSETVYQMRLKDEKEIPSEQWKKELQCLERHKMVISRQVTDLEGEKQTDWYFRHDKIQEFFIVQTFLEKENEARLIDHISDTRFRGVYLLLATMMPIEAAKNLREELIKYAANTKDHTVSDTFIQLFQSRKTAEETKKIR
ncbi:MAG: HEAT repeat domain-containing protein [Microcystis aeruginosa PMC 728.11]|nr:HEAT repeat domain-containing protein [Microcystis aeruginosa PMC 728.11]